MILYGIDPGFASAGMVRWEDGRFVGGQVWRSTKTGDSATQSNLDRGRSLAECLRAFCGQPVSGRGMAVEAMSFARHAGAAHKMGIAWGVLAAAVDLPVFVLSPQAVRRLLDLPKGATKGQIRQRLLVLYPELLDHEPRQTTLWEHYYDAAAVLAAWLRTDQGRFLTGGA